ncbi:MAG TPA: TlpA disulfide reductase family protein [Terriglobales bacterium]|nr:TlpA disulfide reductase family protein [Terriglobales bacterium]
MKKKVVFSVLCALPLVLAQSSLADLVIDVRTRLAQNSSAAAEAELRDYKSRNGVTPEYLDGLSWVARAEAADKRWDKAAADAGEVRTQSERLLARRKLDAEDHLPMALGAAYEVLAQSMEAKGQREAAIRLLRAALLKYGTTSIGPRLQKNVNLLALVGRPAPALEAVQFLGSKPATLASLKGSPVLLFFWAHWCVDCKAEVPVIARLRQEFGARGLVVIGPTQLYGYAAQGADATPAAERTYIEAVRQRYYSSLLDMPVPLSQKNFKTYGASTTPTLVVLNRAGQVTTYHPGAMTYEELRAAVEKAL